MRLISLALAITLLVGSAHAAIPLMINHQGIVKVNGEPFTGNGLFKFGFVDNAGIWRWTNDSSHVGASSSTPPDSSVALSVVNGVYNVTLGDTSITGMTAIPSTVFDTDDVRLRIYFNDGEHGQQLLSPDQQITSVAYAYKAFEAERLGGQPASFYAMPLGSLVMSESPSDVGLIAGGYTYTGRYFEMGRWRECSDMPTSRILTSSTVLNGALYVIGGHNCTGATESYNPLTNSWTTHAIMPTCRRGLTSCTVDNKIYAIGGEWTSPYILTEAYDLAMDTWSTKAPPPGNCNYACSAAVDDIIYVFCGSTTQSYNPQNNTWNTSYPSMPTPRDSAVAIALGTSIYVIGGRQGLTPRPDNEVFDTLTKTWAIRAPIPTARRGSGGATVDNLLYVIAGSNKSNMAVGNVDCYDPVLDEWRTCNPHPAAESVVAGTVGGKIYAVAGNSCRVYDPKWLYIYSRN